MNIGKLQEELEIDEGVKYEIYLDHLGYPTFGVGHLIIDDDPEYGWEVGASIDTHRVNEAFENDVQNVLIDCEKLYVQWEHLPEEVQLIVANMMFNMGYTRLRKFKGMKRGVDARDWNAAADEMVDSRWYNQVTKRADRLVVRMRSVG
jgi:GH24 family phage-related lysozyme (muramidase)